MIKDVLQSLLHSDRKLYENQKHFVCIILENLLWFFHRTNGFQLTFQTLYDSIQALQQVQRQENVSNIPFASFLQLYSSESFESLLTDISSLCGQPLTSSYLPNTVVSSIALFIFFLCLFLVF
jgi:hypothetical protein